MKTAGERLALVPRILPSPPPPPLPISSFWSWCKIKVSSRKRSKYKKYISIRKQDTEWLRKGTYESFTLRGKDHVTPTPKEQVSCNSTPL